MFPAAKAPTWTAADVRDHPGGYVHLGAAFQAGLCSSAEVAGTGQCADAFLGACRTGLWHSSRTSGDNLGFPCLVAPIQRGHHCKDACIYREASTLWSGSRLCGSFASCIHASYPWCVALDCGSPPGGYGFSGGRGLYAADSMIGSWQICMMLLCPAAVGETLSLLCAPGCQPRASMRTRCSSRHAANAATVAASGAAYSMTFMGVLASQRDCSSRVRCGKCVSPTSS